MLRVTWPVVDTIHLKDNKFVTGVKIKAIGELKLNDSPGRCRPLGLREISCSISHLSLETT